ncbi:MAG: efflux RND transporter permease subunit, partial [Luteolibacter sp.]
MNPGEFSVKNNRMIYMAMAMAIIGGILAYLNMGRLEDPEFTIKRALIITPYPGASAEEVAQEVSNPIEVACQQLSQLDFVRSESTRGRSVVTVDIKAQYNKETIPQVWDELRRKVSDVQAQLPPPVRGNSIV